MKWLLIQVIDRQIDVIEFKSFEEANERMVELYNECAVSCSDCCLNSEDAWVTDGYGNHDDCDWKIVGIKME